MAAGYGEGRVTIGRYLAGRVAVTDITAVAALSPRIRFGLSWTLGHLARAGDGNHPEEYHLIDFGGELRLGADDLFVRSCGTDRVRWSYFVGQSEGIIKVDSEWL